MGKIIKSELTPENLPDTLYIKFWQGNNYYPCNRYTNNHDGTLTRAVRKISKDGTEYWYEPELWKGKTNEYNLMYTISNTVCLLSTDEMTDDHTYDYK